MIEDLSTHQWHHLSGRESLDLLESDAEQGLATDEADRRREQYGANRLTVRGGPGALRRLLLQIHQPLIYILIASGIVTAVLQEWVDASVIFGVVVINALIGYVQESKAVKALEALASTMTTQATVLRDGRRASTAAEELVPGDVVILQAGDKVPADVRLLRCRDLQIDESALTGESVPVQKHASELPLETVLADRVDMAYASTLVTYGRGRGLVVATGDLTEVGRISGLLASAQDISTPLTRKIARFSGLLLYIILALGAVTFVVGLLRGETAFDMFLAAVALAVGAIPEGLPAAVTITLAIGVGRMARRMAIVRKLPAVETLGSTTVICSDKTGTLTENQMTVQRVVAGGRHYEVDGAGYQPSGEIRSVGEEAPLAEMPLALRALLVGGMLCNESRLHSVDDRWTVQGDPTEGALLVVGAKAGLQEEALAKELPRLDVIPFESEHQYMATLHAVATNDAAKDSGDPPDGDSPLGGGAVLQGGDRPLTVVPRDAGRVVFAKGAAEVVLRLCSGAVNGDGEPVELDADGILAEVESLAAEGLRVLAFAEGPGPRDSDRLAHGKLGPLAFVGLQAMIDPPRQEAIAAVKACHTAGVSVKMITGDHAITAQAVAERMGLAVGAEECPGGHCTALTGAQLEEIPDDELRERVAGLTVFARVSPEQKLRLVRALQARGDVVAMTGDGVNDAPALRQADIGVAMGITGTDVAKEAADMVLTDDNFASIEAAVEEGRGVFDNIVKFITWTLPTNLGEGLVILAAIFAGTSLPILPVQILWINMTTAVFLGLMLAFEPKESDIMVRRPRAPDTPILTRMLVWRVVFVGLLLLAAAFGLFEWARRSGYDLEVARTVAVNVFVSVELFYLFNCRSLTKPLLALPPLSNRWLLGGVALMVALQALYTYAPFMNAAFGSAPLTAGLWGVIVAVGFAALLVVEIEKRVTRTARRRSARRAGG